MRFLIINTDYQLFIDELYTNHPGLEYRSYAEQMRARWDSLFGTANFYSTHLQKLGHEAWDVIANLEPAQKQWAREHGIRFTEDAPWRIRLRRGIVPWLERDRQRWLYEILAAQIKAYKPDVLYSMAVSTLDSGFLRSVRGYYRIAVGQHAAPHPSHSLADYDLMLSSLPNYVKYYRSQGMHSEYLKLAFAAEVLPELRTCQQQTTKTYDVVFVGSYSSAHASGIRVLAQVATKVPVDFWGPSVEQLHPRSSIRQRHHGNIWGKQMYCLLARSRITLNRHISIAENYANNMRLFETTGVGTLLITDWKINLHEMFEPSKEVLAYRTPEECAELVHYYLEHDDEREAIARAGQQRTLREHTYYQRMQELVDIVRKYL